MCRRAIPALSACLGIASCGGIVTGPDPGADSESVFEAAWLGIDRHYSFFAHNQLDWLAVYAQYRPLVTAATTESELWTVLCSLITELRSFHAGLESRGRGGCGSPPFSAPTNYDRALVNAALQSPRQFTGHMQYGRLDDDIGYVFVPSFGGGFGSEFDFVLRALAGVRALVIDIRGNGGGNESNGAAIASRLVRETRTYQITRFRNGPRHSDFTAEVSKRLRPSGSRFDGPVALLTNRYNGSAAEDFIMMMRVIPTVFTVGDTTKGNASNPLHRELPNGWLMTVPQSIQMTLDRFIVEGRGLAPAFPIMLDPGDASRGIDTILAFAIEELRRRME
jgi:hypothetical protein